MTQKPPKVKFYLIRDDDGDKTLWDLEKDSETGLVLIDVNKGVNLNYLEKTTTKEV